MTRGILYYNSGTKMGCRLATSAASLRRVYDGPGCILSEGKESRPICEEVGRICNLEVIDVGFETPKGRGTVYINATLCHNFTPYDTTVWLDSDTLILRKFDELFDAAESNEFAICQFSDWRTHKKDDVTVPSKIGDRVLTFKERYPLRMPKAIAFGPAINCGVFAFRKGAALMRDWYRTVLPVRECVWIPDEVCCQMMLPDYPHKILTHWLNVSCKYDDPRSPEARIVHWHGRKHCRFEDGKPQYNSDLWWAAYERVREWAEKWEQHDRLIRKFRKSWAAWKAERLLTGSEVPA